MSRPTGITRLKKLYGMVETVRARELGLASHAVDEVIRARERSAARRRADDAAAQAALLEGSFAETVAAIAGHRAGKVQDGRMAHLHQARNAQLTAASVAHRESATELRQVEILLTRAGRETAIAAERAVQRSSDDRFAARRAWVHQRARHLAR